MTEADEYRANLADAVDLYKYLSASDCRRRILELEDAIGMMLERPEEAVDIAATVMQHRLGD